MEQHLSNYMVKGPAVIQPENSLREASKIMKSHHFRHLPVVKGKHLAGLISERDLKEALALPQAHQLKVEDVMKTDVYVAKKSDSLRQVVTKMSELKYGSVVVVDNQKSVVGIFTTTDALRILADFLERLEDDEPYVGEYLESWLPDSLT